LPEPKQNKLRNIFVLEVFMALTDKELKDLTDGVKSEISDDVRTETKAKIEEINTTLKEKLAKIDTDGDRIDMIETKMNRLPIGTSGLEDKGDLPPQKKKGQFHYEVKSDYDKAFFDTYLGKGQKFLGPDEAKALIIGSDPSAGYLTSIEYGREIIKAMEEFSPIRAEATVKPTGGTEISFPKRSALPDTYWVSEIEERVKDTSFEHAMEKLTPHEMISFKRISLSALEDNVFNLAEELGEAFGEAFGKKEGTGFISGSGVKQPEGILTNPDVGSTDTITASVLSPNDIMAFPYTLARGYRRNAKWYLSDIMIAKVRMMRADSAAADDSLGPFLWQNSMIAGEPPTLGGFPVVSCPDMGTTVADGDVVAVFGDMRKAYMIADRIVFQIQELRERYAEFGMVGYIGRKRVDGQVVLPAAIRKLAIQSA